MGNRDTVCLLLMVFSLKATVVVSIQTHLTAGVTLPLEMRKEKVTHLHFYFHDILSGKNPTGVMVAQADTSNQSPTSFGKVFMIDDPLTEGPEPTSKLLGRAQGLYGLAGQNELSLIMALSYVFTEGKYNGSTLSVLTRNPITNPVREFPIVGGTGYFREFPIVGGTGYFRFARGVVVAKTYWFNATAGDAIVEYNVTVIHY